MKTFPDLRTILTAAFLAIAVPPVAVAGSMANAQSTVGVGAAQVYVHPQKGFELTVPADAEIIEREAPVDVSVRSREGWVMHVQSGPASPNSTLEAMAAKLESLYLGANRPWSLKLYGGRTTIAGIAAYESLYEGSGSKTRAVIMRAGNLDMAILFIAPERVFSETQGVFDLMMARFKPPQGPSAPAMAESANAPVRGGPGLFDDGAMGISISYPAGWQVSQPAPHMVVFSMPPEHGGGPANASIQNVASSFSGSDTAAVEGVLQEIMAQLAYSVSDVHHSEAHPIRLARAEGPPAEGRQLVSDYTRFETPFRQWSIAMPRAGSDTVHVFTFVAPRESFDIVRPEIESMVQSWTLTPVAR
ncbi:MAG: hypothetical protein RIC16_02260 [Rhodospirillales bacterium]